ncbi:hypothetical protein [Rhodopirellula sp. MGV]|uniref:hypothetical protein n=1 Tax=Rhodopirellula sp. MGV TaxID=2023130 RepID=UPI000B95FEBE|nr:hypothetical protein [Rhodopirellula sp. MGV]OYP29843.1 hypothetical protein CGZ80_23930 [Rhodopirellula sp. MGV]PNY33725.1 hypothetical protein C2E31_26905 [Rhodopirellula baltica]
MLLIRDLAPLFCIHASLLLGTLVIGGGNAADVRLQSLWLAFLSTGWLIAPQWQGRTSSILTRYCGGMISSIAIYAVTVAGLSWLGQGMQAMLVCWCGISLAAITNRAIQLRQWLPMRLRILPTQVALISTAIVLAVCVYQAPRSNDIHQFILQQQDMTLSSSLQVSSIGMTAMDVDQPMPRWRAHYFHLLPSLFSKASGIAVDLVLQRYLTIPVAFSVIVCLACFVRTLSLHRADLPLCILAIAGPVFFWFRNFNAFNYSFRITNNLLLDKDFALFWLIPAVAVLSLHWVRGRSRAIVPLFMLSPAIVRFHPLTAVYLLLLITPLLLALATSCRFQPRRALAIVGYVCVLFTAVVFIGDAQGNHDQIREIILMDYQQSLDDRPLHYWVGFYNTIPNSDLPSDTLAYDGERLTLKPSVILGCGLLLAMHGAWLVLLAMRLCRRIGNMHVLFATISIIGLWGIWFVSPFILTRAPHISGGYERLHWFAYPAALTTVAIAGSLIIPRQLRRPAHWLIMTLIGLSCLLSRLEIASPITSVRGLNSLLDYEQHDAIKRLASWQGIDPSRTLVDRKPQALSDSDRVLLLDLSATTQYWWVRSGSYWPDCYVEAFAWDRRGDSFLKDRHWFYHFLDRQPLSDNAKEEAIEWLREKRITLIVDHRPGALEYLQQLGVPIEPLDETTFRLTIASRPYVDQPVPAAE